MSKIFAVIAFALAVVVKFTWRHSNIALGFPISWTESRGWGLNEILFWLLLLTGSWFLIRIRFRRSRTSNN